MKYEEESDKDWNGKSLNRAIMDKEQNATNQSCM